MKTNHEKAQKIFLDLFGIMDVTNELDKAKLEIIKLNLESFEAGSERHEMEENLEKLNAGLDRISNLIDKLVEGK